MKHRMIFWHEERSARKNVSSLTDALAKKILNILLEEGALDEQSIKSTFFSESTTIRPTFKLDPEKIKHLGDEDSFPEHYKDSFQLFGALYPCEDITTAETCLKVKWKGMNYIDLTDYTLEEDGTLSAFDYLQVRSELSLQKDFDNAIFEVTLVTFPAGELEPYTNDLAEAQGYDLSTECPRCSIGKKLCHWCKFPHYNSETFKGSSKEILERVEATIADKFAESLREENRSLQSFFSSKVASKDFFGFIRGQNFFGWNWASNMFGGKFQLGEITFHSPSYYHELHKAFKRYDSRQDDGAFAADLIPFHGMRKAISSCSQSKFNDLGEKKFNRIGYLINGVRILHAPMWHYLDKYYDLASDHYFKYLKTFFPNSLPSIDPLSPDELGLMLLNRDEFLKSSPSSITSHTIVHYTSSGLIVGIEPRGYNSLHPWRVSGGGGSSLNVLIIGKDGSSVLFGWGFANNYLIPPKLNDHGDPHKGYFVIREDTSFEVSRYFGAEGLEKSYWGKACRIEVDWLNKDARIRRSSDFTQTLFNIKNKWF